MWVAKLSVFYFSSKPKDVPLGCENGTSCNVTIISLFVEELVLICYKSMSEVRLSKK